MTRGRRTQAERRAATRAAVLESASRLFGEKGFADTSLEEISAEAGVTTGPIYHHFGSKLALFEAVNEAMEERTIASLQVHGADALDAWRGFLALCEDPAFRRIVLVDGPNVLGRSRWTTNAATRTALGRFGVADPSRAGREDRFSELALRMLIGAMTEAALAIAESDDPGTTSREADQLIAAMVERFELQRPGPALG